MYEIGYANYIVFLLVVTGVLLLRQDAKAYQVAKMKRETKAAKFMGWLNIAVGIFVFLADWAIEKWFW
ncbi:CLC_0170 family protein [Fictibacillus terranigra]|uniref:Uncharacterized protein n=1 Tax=Fictibacillus terranigra TaxID=3058424 RepID=A0ABT8EBM2_9BACL|nr:CLC_0170 family protein [Fictibacillus sp. CENA-BCM004]MDN4075290.1 hypothetical protein [Fictibacillus sp. CENA-BCM004]